MEKRLERIGGLLAVLIIVSVCMAGAFDSSIWVQVIGWIGLVLFTPISIKVSLMYEALEERRL